MKVTSPASSSMKATEATPAAEGLKPAEERLSGRYEFNGQVIDPDGQPYGTASYVSTYGTAEKFNDVSEVKILGNETVSEERLAKVFEIHAGLSITKQTINEGIEKLTAYYRGLGFFRVEIGHEIHIINPQEQNFREREKPESMTVTIIITEGPRYEIRNVAINGNKKYTDEKLLKDLKLKGGEYYNQGKMTDDLKSLQAKYASAGYLLTDVKANLRFLKPDGILDLIYTIDEGLPSDTGNREKAAANDARMQQNGERILARVGTEVIYAKDITPAIDRYLADVKNRMSSADFELHREEFEKQREMLLKQRLKSAVESRLILLDAKHEIPADGIAKVNQTLADAFEKNELPKLMKRENATTTTELEQKLDAYGNSIDQERKAFIEKSLVGEWIRRQIKAKELPTVSQTTQFYDTHKTDFTTPSKARWEELTVSKAKYPSKESALAAVVRMRNQVNAGTPFADVAKHSSDGFTAAEGGLRDWGSKGRFVDAEIEKAVFSLPVGKLSQSIETASDYTIIRVIERVDQTTKSFEEVQAEISKKIIEDRSNRLFVEYLDRLKSATNIWTTCASMTARYKSA